MKEERLFIYSKRYGYTLLELTCAVVIIAILASILLPTLAKSREQARRVKCASNLHKLSRSNLR